MNNLIAIISLAFVLSACSNSITLVHTEGVVSDLIDSNQSAEAEAKLDGQQ